MVKGISRQVIVVHAPEPKMFEQAIFILKDGALEREGVTDEALLQEARRVLYAPSTGTRKSFPIMSLIWACCGAAFTGIVWLVTELI